MIPQNFNKNLIHMKQPLVVNKTKTPCVCDSNYDNK